MRTSAIFIAACFTVTSASYHRRGTIPNGSVCQTDTDCVSNQCVIPPAGPSECGAINLALNADCIEDVQCTSGYCPNFTGSKSGVMYKCTVASERPLRPAGADCNRDVECQSSKCDAQLHCTTPDPGTVPCTRDADCTDIERCIATIADPKKSTCLFINLPLGLLCIVDSQCYSTYCNKTKLSCDLAENRPTNPGGNNSTSTGGQPTVNNGGPPQTVTTTLPGGAISTVIVTPSSTQRGAAGTLHAVSGLATGVFAAILGVVGGVGLIL